MGFTLKIQVVGMLCICRGFKPRAFSAESPKARRAFSAHRQMSSCSLWLLAQGSWLIAEPGLDAVTTSCGVDAPGFGSIKGRLFGSSSYVVPAGAAKED